jgi:hypothetical protein
MQRLPPDKPRLCSDLTDSERIDALYGLEPVLEPGGIGSAGAESGAISVQSVECPYCGETFETSVDLSAGSSSYVEDCQVCCQPIEFAVAVGDGGELLHLTAARGD